MSNSSETVDDDGCPNEEPRPGSCPVRGSWYPSAPLRLQPGAPHLPRGSRTSSPSSRPGSRRPSRACGRSKPRTPSRACLGRCVIRAADSSTAPGHCQPHCKKTFRYKLSATMFEEHDAAAARPLWLVTEGEPRLVARDQDAATRALARGDAFPRRAPPGRCRPGAGRRVAPGRARPRQAPRPRFAGALARRGCAGAAAAGAWRIATALPAGAATAAAIGWAYGCYRFDRYRMKSAVASRPPGWSRRNSRK